LLLQETWRHVEHVMAERIHNCNRWCDENYRAKSTAFLAPRTALLRVHHLANTTARVVAQ
jgi:hypothetical protein